MTREPFHADWVGQIQTKLWKNYAEILLSEAAVELHAFSVG
ncbi:hypothetical protein D042_2911 [Vibrio parahaemolyticus NIHCB0757]|nr:hypothetical protein D042_2911 [Vibrio parahaemolyticus NIHCB0757]